MRIILLCTLILSLIIACSPPSSAASADSLPPGDADNGAALFTESIGGAPACSTCHTLDEIKLVGPGLQGYAERAIIRVEGVSAEDYTYASIVRPAAHVVEGFVNTMYPQYEQHLTSQQIADLIAYLLTL
jgi:cytochrome c2